MANQLYTASPDCPNCNGSGLRNTELFYREECECVLIGRIRSHVKEFENFPILKTSPLLAPLNSNRSLVIETDDIAAVKAHIKTSLVLNKQFKSFKVVHSGELVELSINNPKLIEGVDLLIEFGEPFPHYEKASSRHEFVFATRDVIGKPTWFIIKSLAKFQTANPLMVPTWWELLKRYPTVRIAKNDIDGLRKTPAPSVTSDLKLKRGLGLSGIDQRLLSFHPEMDKRLQGLKGTYDTE